MGKRSDFLRKENDAYDTPYEAIIPLLPFLPRRTEYIEPCAGDGRLVGHLQKHGHSCMAAYDIAPRAKWVKKRDVLLSTIPLPQADLIITNPPWDRNRDGTGPLHEMIKKFVNHCDTWMLFDADWAHTLQAIPFEKYIRNIVAVGRISWEGNGISGKDNCCWYRLSTHGQGTRFHFRVK